MGQDTKIQWTHHTFNPWRGCTKVSAGCANCYADRQSVRNPKVLGVWGPNGTRVVASEAMWREPLKWDRDAAQAGERRRVFCASLADVFEGCDTMPPGVYSDIRNARVKLFLLIERTPHLDWLLLTKRPENVMEQVREVYEDCLCEPSRWPLPNVWLGTSVENQQAADERIPHLLRCPAAVRFLSVEPLIGPVDLTPYMPCGACNGDGCIECSNIQSQPWGRAILHWVIIGGESGPGARPCNVEWIRSIVGQCKAAGVAAFVKQLGAHIIDRNDAGWDADSHRYTDNPRNGELAGRAVQPTAWPDYILAEDRVEDLDGYHYQGAPVRVRAIDPKGGDPAEWPEDLRVREWPAHAKEGEA